MKRIIFLFALSVFFTCTSKAYWDAELTSDYGHKYKYYNCDHYNFSYFLRTYVLDKDTYGYASITLYYSDNTVRVFSLRGNGGPEDIAYGVRIDQYYPLGPSRTVNKIKKVKLAVSGEVKPIYILASTPDHYVYIGKTYVKGTACIRLW